MKKDLHKYCAKERGDKVIDLNTLQSVSRQTRIPSTKEGFIKLWWLHVRATQSLLHWSFGDIADNSYNL